MTCSCQQRPAPQPVKRPDNVTIDVVMARPIKIAVPRLTIKKSK